MLKRLASMAALLAVLLVASVPALAQLGPSGGDYPYNFFVYSPETGGYVDCRLAGGATAEFCLANGIDPPVEYSVRPDGGYVSTPVGLPGYTDEDVDRVIRAQIQYDNAR